MNSLPAKFRISCMRDKPNIHRWVYRAQHCSTGVSGGFRGAVGLCYFSHVKHIAIAQYYRYWPTINKVGVVCQII